ncbi:uncharacterized protein N7459_007350 [Penicillium hispanicum]|uniref:uncharacterized protein n=1 Tax=Penicillium hispanicum TaxID=1080232 RepID=UPI0025403BE4|nr:uncharacterized protein N7459_007350 [Penicillium hispanicum]KAJ5578386.1 hypothetical protein N7459_007350 [Penicillium hispanicum]
MIHAQSSPCYTCRTRRIQCDQSGVPCTKCEKAGLECLDKRPIRWVKGVAVRGKMQGRSYATSAASSGTGKESGGLPGESRRALTKKTAPRCLERPESHGLSLSLPFALQDPSCRNLDRASRYYIDYYNKRICKLFIVYDSDRNPFRRLISLGLKDQALLKALLALAARHHANNGQSFYQPEETPTLLPLINANRSALSFKHQAMEALSHSLRDARRLKQDTTVASIFLLIFLDLLESGSDGWNLHLEGAKNLIASTYPQSVSPAGVNRGPGETVQEIRGFITKQIRLIETLGATFLRPRLLSQFSSFYQPELQPRETVEQSFLGCPDYILTAIQRLSMHRDSIHEAKPLDPDVIRSHSEETARLLELVRNFDSHAWVSNLQQSRQSSPEEVVSLSKLSESYQLGTLLYGRRILDALTEEVTAQEELVLELLGLVDSLKGDTDMFKCILWPVFIAGLECDWQAQRDFVVGCLERFWAITNCLNAVNAAKILQEYWRQNISPEKARSQWIFNIGQLGRDWLWI